MLRVSIKKYWITLFSETFLWMRNGKGLIYNTREFECYQFQTTARIARICSELLEDNNLYTTEITDEDMEDNEFKRWVQSVTEIRAGFITNGAMKKPVSLYPFLKIQDDKILYRAERKQTESSSSLMQNLHELSFYINGSESGNDAYFKQSLFPLKSCKDMDVNKILSFIRNSSNIFLSTINWVGNIFSYPQMNELFAGLESLNYQNKWMMPRIMRRKCKWL